MQDRNQAGWNLQATYQTLPKAFFSQATPTPVGQPQLLLVNSRVAGRLGLDPSLIQDQVHAEIFSGNRLPPNSATYCAGLCGPSVRRLYDAG